MAQYRTVSKVISITALAALKRHLWYLSEKLVQLGLFSDLVVTETKQRMVINLRQNSDQNPMSADVLDTLQQMALQKKHLMHSSHLFFDILGLDTTFLDHGVERWQWLDLPYLLAAKRSVQAMKVVNDSAERGISLSTTFNSTVTKQKEQKQFLFQVVESYRKRFPNSKKSTILNVDKSDVRIQ